MTARPSQQQLHRLALAVLAAFLLYGSARLLMFVPAVLRYPYELDYGEGIVLQQMRNILRGVGYAPLGVYPAIVYHYPPVYHLVAGATAAVTGLDDLVAGRLVSIAATLGSAGLVAAIVAAALADQARRRIGSISGLFGGLLLLNSYSIQLWAPLMRVDMLALFFDLAGIGLAVCAIRRTGWIYAASFVFALAMYTKQTAIAAPVATFAVLLALRPGLALRGIAAMAVAGLVTLGALSWWTHGGFLRHVLVYNINRFDTSRLSYLVGLVFSHASYVVVAGFGVLETIRRLRIVAPTRMPRRDAFANDPALVCLLILLGYLAVVTVMLAMIMKIGSNVNYFIEWLCATALFFGIGLHRLVTSAFDDSGAVTARLSPLLLVAVAVGVPFQSRYMLDWNGGLRIMARLEKSYAPVVEMIRVSQRPVIADPMTLLIRAGRPIEWEPAIAAELAHTGAYDEPAFIRMVRERRFGFFALEGDPTSRLFRDRYNPAVRDAIRTAYPVQRRIANLTIYLPPDARTSTHR